MEEDSNESSRTSIFIEKQSFVWNRDRNKAISGKKKKKKVELGHMSIESEPETESNTRSAQEIADDYFLAGDLNQAAKYYAVALEEQTKFDSNNNDESIDAESRSIEWSESYLESKLSEVEKKIEILPDDDVASYLEKAALLFLQDRWAEARVVLATAMTKCSDKSQIRVTIGNLNKLERSLALAIG